MISGDHVETARAIAKKAQIIVEDIKKEDSEEDLDN